MKKGSTCIFVADLCLVSHALIAHQDKLSLLAVASEEDHIT